MRSEDFPGLSQDGMTLTYERGTALTREDYAFVTWEHPMVTACMEMLLGDDTGNSTLSLLEGHDLVPGTLLLEALYVLDPVAPRSLRAGRFLPPTLIRTLVDELGRDRRLQLPHERVAGLAKPVERALAAQAIRQSRERLGELIDIGARLANERKRVLIGEALRRMMEDYTSEIGRLQALRLVNPNLREQEIQDLQEEGLRLHRHLQASQLRLDALRVLIAG
jgi:ATP-dependent helicase HepA